MRIWKLVIGVCFVWSGYVSAREMQPTELQQLLIGHWVAAKDSKMHTYYSINRRLVDRDIPNSDARFEMSDYQIWDEWPDLRTIVLSVSISEGTQVPVLLVITLGEDGRTAVCREKSLAGWSKSIKIIRVDNNTHPTKLPEKLKILDVDSGVAE